MVDSDIPLSADTILQELPGLIYEEHISQALNRWAFASKPEPDDIDLLAHLLESDEMVELKRRYTCEPPYCQPPGHLPFKSGSVDEVEDLG